MFARVNAIGWGFAAALTSAQMNQLDIDHANAVDGAAGGTYAPTTRIVFAGALATPFEVQGNLLTAGLTGTGTFQFSGGGAFTGANIYQVASPAIFNINAGAAFNSLGPASFLGTSSFQGTVSYNAFAPATFAATATFNGTAVFNGAVTYAGTPSFGAGATFTGGGSVIFGGAVGVGLQGTTTNTGVLSSTGAGRVVPRPAVAYADADHTIGLTSGSLAASGADCVSINNGSITTNRTCTLLNAGATPGSRIRFSSYDDLHTLTVQTENGIILAKLKSGTVAVGGIKGAPPAGFWNWIDLEFVAANFWNPIGGQSA